MKKIISLITVFIMLCCALASCADTNATTGTTATPVKVELTEYTYEEYLDGVLSSYIFALHKDEAKYLESLDASVRDDIFVDEEKIGDTKEYEINGKKYTFTYKESNPSDAYKAEIKDKYICEYEGKEINLTYNPALDRVTAVYSIPGGSGKDITRDEAFEKAKDFIKKHHQEDGEFEIEYENDRGDTYYFRFRRIVDGFKVDEKATVEINYDGTLCAYIFRSMGAFDGVDLTAINMEKINSVIKEKCDKVYEGYTYEVTEQDIMFDRKADGSFFINCTVHTLVEGGQLSKKTNDRTCMFIYIK
jgi:hypothetical protein